VRTTRINGRCPSSACWRRGTSGAITLGVRGPACPRAGRSGDHRGGAGPVARRGLLDLRPDRSLRERLPGRSHKTRPLCQSHADAVFGIQDPPWRRLDEKPQREIVEEWLRSITILAHGGHRPPAELLAEIAAVNDTGTETVRLMSPLMPGEARDLRETQRAVGRLRSRETMVHAAVTQILIDWHATATGQERAEIIQQLALRLYSMFDQPGPPSSENPG